MKALHAVIVVCMVMLSLPTQDAYAQDESLDVPPPAYVWALDRVVDALQEQRARVVHIRELPVLEERSTSPTVRYALQLRDPEARLMVLVYVDEATARADIRTQTSIARDVRTQRQTRGIDGGTVRMPSRRAAPAHVFDNVVIRYVGDNSTVRSLLRRTFGAPVR